jgi:hypothetical protein
MIEKTTDNRNYPKPDLNNTLQDDVGHIQSAMDMIDTDIHGMKQEVPLLAGSYPFLHCKMRRAGRSGTSASGSWTSEMGTLNNNAATAPAMFKQFIGGNDNNYDIYSIPPTLQFVGPNARWRKADIWMEHTVHENQRKYGAYEMILMFFKNTGETDLTRPFSRYFSTTGINGDYGKSSAYVGTPDQTDVNAVTISSIDWAVVHSLSDNQGSEAVFDITIPAGKTVALLFYSSGGCLGAGSSYYYQATDIGIYDFGNFICDGLTVDHKRTLKAMQRMTPNIHEIWR